MIYKKFSPENLNGHYPQDRGKIVIVKDDDGVARVENQGGELTRSFLAMAAGALGRYIRNEVDDEGSIDICKTAFNDELDYPRSNGGDLVFEVRNDAIHTAVHLIGYLRGVSALRANANYKIRTLKERAKLFPEQESKELSTIHHCDHLQDDGIGNAAENGICSICGANVQKWGR